LIRRHSLSVVSIGVLIMWIFLYSVSSPSTHTGSFFGMQSPIGQVSW
jgi:hypothetical protein